MVGNGMFLLASFDDAINCVDKAGPGHRTSRHPVGATNTVRGVLAGDVPDLRATPIDCATSKSDPQKYTGQVGDSKYYVKKYGPSSRGHWSTATTPRRPRTPPRCSACSPRRAGIDITDTSAQSSRDPQSAYTPVIQQMKNDGDNYNLTGSRSTT